MATPSIATIAATRFGYGFHPDQALASDVDGLLAELGSAGAHEPSLGGPSLAERGALYSQYLEARNARRKDISLTPIMQGLHRQINAQFRADVARRIEAPILSDRGFFERLSWFWADHFTTAARNLVTKSLTPRLEPDAIRPNITGSFRDMLRAVVTHPAMIVYLGQHNSVGPASKVGKRTGRGLNENLAREVIELHTLGVGGPYTQGDVRQFAELLTGMTINRRTGATVFKTQQAEPGTEEVLGAVYGDNRPDIGDIVEALDDLAVHPRTGRHIAKKLATHFVSDTPSEGLITHIESAFNRTDGRLVAVYQALLEHPESWVPEALKVKQPFDYIISSVRAAGVGAGVGVGVGAVAPFLKHKGRLSIARALHHLNQTMMQAPGPDGWPEEADRWITAQGLAARLQWAARLGRDLEGRMDPRDYLAIALGDRASPEVTFAATNAAEKWEGIALILASPEFNRR